MPVDCCVLGDEAVYNLNDDSISFPCVDSWTGGGTINGDNKLLEAVDGFVPFLYFPDVPSCPALCR